MSKIICLMGPTASGKTDIAVELAQKFPLEIISVDSAMVYRDMNIGTAKPTADILRIAPHYLIDICDPSEAYSAAAFCKDAILKIQLIHARNHIPLLVGGTMMYFRALQNGLAELPSANPEIREAILFEAEKNGWPALHAELLKKDPIAAHRIHPHDGQRIQRALEVYRITGKTLTTLQKEQGTEGIQHHVENIVLTLEDRALLHERIARRFQQMLASGFIEEVEALRARGDLNLELPSMRSVGYRQVWEYLDGLYGYETLLEKGTAATRQLAKRQLTWLRSWSNTQVFFTDKQNVTQKLVERVASIVTV